MIFTRQEKMLLTPTYHVFKMYVPFHDATFVPIDVTAGTYKSGDIELPRVDAIAARDTAGKLWLSLTNLDPNLAVSIDVDISGTKVTSAKGLTLAAPRIDSVNTFEAPGAVTPKPFSAKAAGKKLIVKLAPASVTVVELE
jgi:alpha-N-arabinofuranosidase